MNAQIKEIQPEEFSPADDTALIDVRTDEEWKEGHLTGALHIPLDTLEDAEIPEKAKLVLYCRAGVRSMKGAGILVSRGFSNVHSIVGGIEAAAEHIEVVTD